MRSFSVSGVGLIAPGFESWEQGKAVFSGSASYTPAPLGKAVPELLPANERRRVSPVAKLALVAAHEAMSGGDAQRSLAGAVFASSSSDVEMAHKICAAACLPEHPVSPTDFHNSVHNAASGYWSIATGSQIPTTSISAGDASFSAGLLDALLMLEDADGPVLLVCFEWLASAPLGPNTPIASSAAVALLIDRANPRWALEQPGGRVTETPASQPALEILRKENPAMRAIPLLELICGAGTTATLPYVNGTTVSVVPVS